MKPTPTATAVLKHRGQLYELRKVDKICGTPAIAILAEAWGAILRAGHGSKSIPVNWDQSAVFFEYEGRPVAVISYSYTEWNSQVWINLGYVKPKHRSRGLYTALYHEVRKIAISKGARTLASGIDCKNKAMISAAESVGRKPLSISYGETLPLKKEAAHA